MLERWRLCRAVALCRSCFFGALGGAHVSKIASDTVSPKDLSVSTVPLPKCKECKFYRANLALIQSVYKNNKEEVLKCPVKFSEMCKYLYSEYKGKNENLNKNIWEQLTVSETQGDKKKKIVIPENVHFLTSFVFFIVIVEFLI